MSKILYPIFKLPNENDDEKEAVPTWIKWWMINNYKKRNWILSEIITGNPLTLENSVETKFYLPPLPRGNTSQVQYSGKQLLPFTNQNVTLGGVTFKAVNGRLILNGTATENINGSYFLTDNFKVSLGSGNYVLSRTIVNSNLTIMLMLLDGTVVAQLPRTISDLSVSLTIASANNYYIAFYIPAGSTFNNYDSGVMISTTGGTYEPYVGGTASPNPPYPQAIQNVTGDVEVVVQNKNMINFSNEQFNVYKEYQNLNIPAGTYTFSSKITSSDTDGSICRVYFYGTDVSPVFINLDRNIRSSATVTLNGTYNRIILYASYDYTHSTGDTAVYEDCQLEQGSTATTYTPHKEQTFTFPLGTQRMYAGDYLADDGIHHVRKQIVLDGTETWGSSGGVFYTTSITDYATSSNIPYSNYFIGYSNVDGSTSAYNQGDFKVGFINVSGLTTPRLYFRNDSMTSATNFKTWLSTNNTTVEYELAEEEVTPYTTEQQTVYDEIKQALSYNEQTNISGSSDELNPIFEVQYYMENESENESDGE